ncbi:MAG: PTS sugar transporter subunit IIA [Pseudomonadota bacterium]
MEPIELLDPEGLSLANSATSKKRVLEDTAVLLARHLPASQREPVYEKLLERERLGSTGVGHGVALPHARVEGLERACGAFVQLHQGVDFDAIDDRPVDLVFALIVPQQATNEHLKLLARLAALFSDAEVRRRLRHSRTAADVLNLFGESQQERESA